jgi:ATP-dependent Zn protease
MEVMDGLATYQLIKTGITVFVFIILLLVSFYLIYYNTQQNYQSSTICKITSSTDGSFTQTVTYTVNNKVYTKSVPAVVNTDKGVSTKNFQYTAGLCTVYYPKNNPDAYSLNIDPTTVSQIIAGILFVIVILMSFWFMFLRSNRKVAGVVGGIDAARNILGIFKNRNY